ncbi:MAG: hypothetical protein DMF45_10250 [Verrucomicrobia bacterium]|nr:MAG: hypothetical protein DMF45_10250 [Verrucomicrobiota bacterium]
MWREPSFLRPQSHFETMGALAGGIISVGIDAVSGAYNWLYPNPVSVHLVPTSKSKTAKRSTTAVSEEKPHAKSTKTQAKSGTSPKIETRRPSSESVATPAPTATPYVPPSLESSPSP